MYLIGHRGNSATAPENTMTSFQMALDLGASGVELDVAFTRDNQIVVFHDVVLDRTTDGKGLLKSKDYDSVKSLDAGSWFSSKFAGEKVPLLEDVFSTFGRSAQRIIVELKGEQEKRQLLATKVISLIEKYTLQEQIQLLVYDFPTLDFLYSQDQRCQSLIFLQKYHMLQHLVELEIQKSHSHLLQNILLPLNHLRIH